MLQDLENQQRLEMSARFRLAKVYRKAGRDKDTEKIEADLLKRLAYADPVHPVLLRLKGHDNLALDPPPK